MSNATARVATTTVPWGDDQIKRVPAAVAQTWYPGAMVATNSSGNAVKCDDTAGITFDGINRLSNNLVINSDDTTDTMALDQSKQLTVHRPWRFTMTMSGAVATDIGSAVYASDDKTVAKSTSNSILVGWIDEVLSTTLVLIKPAYAPLTNLAVSSNTLTFTGSTGANTIVMPDNLADALSVKEGSNSYLKFITTNSAEAIVFGKAITQAVGASTAAAGSTNADAGALPAGTAYVYPTTAADDTKGVIIDVADKVTGRVFFVGNGVSNKILKIYPPSGGSINGAAGDAAFSTASGKGALVVCLSSGSNTWLAM